MRFGRRAHPSDANLTYHHNFHRHAPVLDGDIDRKRKEKRERERERDVTASGSLQVCQFHPYSCRAIFVLPGDANTVPSTVRFSFFFFLVRRNGLGKHCDFEGHSQPYSPLRQEAVEGPPSTSIVILRDSKIRIPVSLCVPRPPQQSSQPSHVVGGEFTATHCGRSSCRGVDRRRPRRTEPPARLNPKASP